MYNRIVYNKICVPERTLQFGKGTGRGILCLYFSFKERRGVPMLEVKHLSYTVTENQETLPIVTDISFTVNDGEMLVITGPNGGGKSTIAKLLMGVIRETEGTILLDGQDITPMSIDHSIR